MPSYLFDLLDRVESGTVVVAALDVQKVVTFARPMTDSNYKLLFSREGISVNVTISSKTVTGFTLNLGLSLTGPLDWVAVAPY